MSLKWAVAGLGLLTFSCAPSESTHAADAGIDVDAQLDTTHGIVEPTAPAVVDFGDCAAGFRPRVEGDHRICDLDTRLACPEGQAHFVGESACVPVGDPCPPGLWPVVPSAASPIYVSRGATDGDGTLGAPFGSLEEALRGRATNRDIFLSSGNHSLSPAVGVPSGTQIYGHCAADTRLSAGGVGLTFSGEGSIANLRIDGAAYALSIEDGARVQAHGVVIENSPGVGILVLGEFTADEVVVAGTRQSSARADSIAIGVSGGGRATFSRLLMRDNQGMGVVASRGSALTVTDAASVDSVASTVDGIGYAPAFTVGSDSTGVFTRVLVDGARWTGVMAQQEGASVQLHDVVVRGTLPVANSGYDNRGGLAVLNGALMTATNVLLSDNTRGAEVSFGGTFTADSVWIEDSHGDRSNGYNGYGLWAIEGGQVTLGRAMIRGSSDRGLLIENAETVVDLTDARVEDTSGAWDPSLSWTEQGTGLGVSALSGAFSCTRCAILRGTGFGIGVGEGGSANLVDVRISDTRADGLLFVAGRGLGAGNATVTADRLLVEGSREVGIGLFEATTSFTAHNLIVQETTTSDCFPEDCAFGGGIGVGTYGGARMTLDTFLIRGSALAAVQVGYGGDGTAEFDLAGTAMLRNGIIENNPVGINLQDPDADLQALFGDTVFIANGRNLDATALPLPMLPGE